VRAATGSHWHCQSGSGIVKGCKSLRWALDLHSGVLVGIIEAQSCSRVGTREGEGTAITHLIILLISGFCEGWSQETSVSILLGA
jgi:hypothetical protein